MDRRKTNKKHIYTNKKSFTGNKFSSKPTMNHIKGIPASPCWSNKFSAIIIESNLLYISNNYIVNIDLQKKEFYQLICFDSHSKLSVLTKIDDHFILAISTDCRFIFIQKYFNNIHIEDKHKYFRELKLNYKFNEINSNSNSSSGKNVSTINIKTILNIKKESLIICGDSEGNIHILKYFIKGENILDFKFLFSMNISLLIGSYTTDMIYIEKNKCLFISTSNGEILIFLLINENLIRIESEINSEKLKKKFLYSIDFINLSENLNLLSCIDKNGSIIIYQILFNNKEDPCLTSKLLLYEKNKFNDMSINEKYLYFICKFIKCNSTFILMISSNKGKIYYTNPLPLSFTNSEVFSLNYKEISENPHNMCIYNVIECDNKLLVISADNNISIFTLPDLLFEFDIKTLKSKPKLLQIQNYSNKNIYLFNDNDEFFQYSHVKKLNALTCSVRKITSKKLCTGINDAYNDTIKISKMSQSNFNENIFALELKNNAEDHSFFLIYYYSADICINTLSIKNRVINFFFNSVRNFDSKNAVSNDNLFSDIKSERKKENLKNSIDSLFADKSEYELLYILDSSGIITIWDYIKNKYNRFKINAELQITSALFIPIPIGISQVNTNSINTYTNVNNRNEFFIFTVTNNCNFNNVVLYIINQVFSIPILTSNTSINVINNKTLTDGVSENQLQFSQNLIDYCYFKSESNNDDKINMIIFLLESGCNLKIYIFDTEYVFNNLSNFEYDLENDNSNISYLKYLEVYQKFKYSNQENFSFISEFNNISNCEINCMKTLKSFSSNSENISFAVAQVDHLIKIFELAKIKEGYQIILKYSIYGHNSRIVDLCWADEDTVVTISVDQSLKIWKISLCKLINLIVSESVKPITHEVYKMDLVNNITKINSSCLFQQSFKTCQDFNTYFEKYYDGLDKKDEKFNIEQLYSQNSNNSGDDMLLFSLFHDKSKNFEAAEKVLTLEIKNILDNSNFNNYFFKLINLLLYCVKFNIINTQIQNRNDNMWKLIEKKLVSIGHSVISNVEKLFEILENFRIGNFDFLKEFYHDIAPWNYYILIFNDKYQQVIQILMDNNLYTEALIVYKLLSLDIQPNFPLFIKILEKLKSFIYNKQPFQSFKCEKVIEVLKKYFSVF